MPDPAIREPFETPADKRPILETTPHDYIESEFPEGKGRCDVCGGGPEAKIHHFVDPMERIASALENLAAIGSVMLGMMQEESDRERHIGREVGSNPTPKRETIQEQLEERG